MKGFSNRQKLIVKPREVPGKNRRPGALISPKAGKATARGRKSARSGRMIP